MHRSGFIATYLLVLLLILLLIIIVALAYLNHIFAIKSNTACPITCAQGRTALSTGFSISIGPAPPSFWRHQNRQNMILILLLACMLCSYICYYNVHIEMHHLKYYNLYNCRKQVMLVHCGVHFRVLVSVLVLVRTVMVVLHMHVRRHLKILVKLGAGATL